MQKDLLSIVMVNFNQASFLRQAIASVVAQTYDCWELVIIDDGSGDNSLEVIEECRANYPQRIRLATHPLKQNLGIAASYQLGIRLCQGEFIGFLESDDFWHPDNALRKLEFLKTGEAGFVYSDVDPIGESEIIRLRRRSLRLLAGSPALKAFDAFYPLAVINFIPTFSIVIARAEALQELTFLSDPRFRMGLDWFLWLQISLRQRFLFIPERLVSWRLYRKSYFNEFLLCTSRIRLIVWGLAYRILLLHKVILPFKCGIWKKIKIIGIFLLSFVRRTEMELWKKDC